MQSNLIKGLFGNNSELTLTESANQTLEIYLQQLQQRRERLPKQKAKVPVLQATLEDQKRQLAELQSQPASAAADPAIRKKENDQHERNIKIMQNKIEQQKREIKQHQQNMEDNEKRIVELVGQIACLGRLQIDQEGTTDLCSLCTNTYTVPEKTSICGHVFCSRCITEFIKKHKHCPTCHTSLSIEDLQPISDPSSLSKFSMASLRPATQSFLEMGSQQKEKRLEVIDHYGSKIEALVRYLSELLQSDPSVKVIVFSKFDHLLRALSQVLEGLNQSPNQQQQQQQGDKGKQPMTTKEQQQQEEPAAQPLVVTCAGNIIMRQKVLEKFRSRAEGSPRVLLLSLTHAAAGTHLTVASHVVLVDPVAAGTAEEAKAMDGQAVARAHRLGQDRPVTAVRFLVRRSIDQDDYGLTFGAPSNIS
jgi:SNF2 family DNA or RNA helicase